MTAEHSYVCYTSFFGVYMVWWRAERLSAQKIDWLIFNDFTDSGNLVKIILIVDFFVQPLILHLKHAILAFLQLNQLSLHWLNFVNSQ